jgi:hypothetical protein
LAGAVLRVRVAEGIPGAVAVTVMLPVSAVAWRMAEVWPS